MHFRTLSRIVRFAVVGAVFTLTVSAGAQMVNTTVPYSSTILNPCNNEWVDFSGTIRFHEKTQVSSDGRIHFVANNNFSASGRGRSTGWSYSIGGTMHTNSKFPTYPITFRQRTKVVSSGAADNFHATFAFHANSAGVQTNVTTESDCK